MAVWSPKEILNDQVLQLAADIGPSDTSITVKSNPDIADGAHDMPAVIVAYETYRGHPLVNPERKENIVITNVSGTTFTVTRDGTNPQSFSTNDILELRWAKSHVDDIHNALTDGTQEINVGAASIQGNATVSGDLGLGAGGVNTLWRRFIHAQDMFVGSSSPAAAPAVNVWASNRTETYQIAFDAAADERAFAVLRLPDDYDGRAMNFHIYWSAIAGTSGDVRWAVGTMAAGDGDDLSLTSGQTFAAVTDTFQGLDILHVTSASTTPGNAGSGAQLLVLAVVRDADNGADTFDADANLIGVEVYY